MCHEEKNVRADLLVGQVVEYAKLIDAVPDEDAFDLGLLVGTVLQVKLLEESEVRFLLRLEQLAALVQLRQQPLDSLVVVLRLVFVFLE